MSQPSPLLRLCVGPLLTPLCRVAHSFRCRIPWPCFDVHVLRTSKQKLVVKLTFLEGQYGPCRATESIQEVIRALNFTMNDVEEAWSVWRHEYVRNTLRNGISFPSHFL